MYGHNRLIAGESVAYMCIQRAGTTPMQHHLSNAAMPPHFNIRFLLAKKLKDLGGCHIPGQKSKVYHHALMQQQGDYALHLHCKLCNCHAVHKNKRILLVLVLLCGYISRQ